MSWPKKKKDTEGTSETVNGEAAQEQEEETVEDNPESGGEALTFVQELRGWVPVMSSTQWALFVGAFIILILDSILITGMLPFTRGIFRIPIAMLILFGWAALLEKGVTRLNGFFEFTLKACVALVAIGFVLAPFILLISRITA